MREVDTSRKDVRCVVLTHGDGPQCVACYQPMDAIRVVSKGHEFYGSRAHYCFHCILEKE